MHITTGGGGGPIDGNMPSPVLALGIDVNHYTKVHVDGDTLQLSAHAISGAVIDRFELSKKNSEDREKVVGPSVATDKAREVVSLYQELLADQTYELQLWCEDLSAPGKTATLTLELSKLPRGAIDLKMVPEDATLTLSSTAKSAWQILSQTLKIHDGVLRFSAVAPKSLVANKNGISPAAEVTMQLTTGGLKYEPITATARLKQ